MFGSKQYIRTSSKSPDRYSDNFSAFKGQGRIIIQNGTESGANRIIKAVIHVNNTLIIVATQFDASTYQTEMTIDLEAQNTLSVELIEGKRNSYLTIKIVQSLGPPIIEIKADPETIHRGEKSILTWSSTNVRFCTLQPGFEFVAANGSTHVSPKETTVYIIKAYQDEGSDPVEARVTVTVLDPLPPTVTITAEPATIQPNGKSTLTWSSTGAKTCLIEPGIGAVETSGSIQVSPAETTTYKITASGEGGTATESVTVATEGLPLPTVTLSADQATINPGDSTIIRWTSTHADYCIIGPCVNSQKPTGTVQVWPNQTTNYCITVYGAGGTAAANITVVVRDYPMPTVTFNSDRQTVQPNGTVTLTWSSNYANSCVIEPEIGGVTSYGSIKVAIPETKTFTITAYGPGFGRWATSSVTVNATGIPLPTVNFSAEPRGIQSGGTTTLRWTSSHADSCKISPRVGTFGPTGEIQIQPRETTVYTITASGPGGSTTKEATVYVGEPPLPTADLMAAPYAIYRGRSTTFSWKTSYSYHCEIRSDYDGYFDIACRGNTWPTTRSPVKTQNYTLMTYNSAWASVSDAVRITVINPPNIGITANPPKILPGEKTTLSWQSPDIESCIIEPDIGVVGSSGSIQVSPTTSTDYTITVIGPLGPVSSTIKVTVLAPPKVSISASPQAIFKGGSTNLSWSSTDVTSCVIEPGIGAVGPSSSKLISPSETTTYTITATNPLGTTTAETTVSVYDPPVVTLDAGPSIINQGESSVLTWSSVYADSCSISPGIGTVAANGALTVKPSATTTYTITASNPGGNIKITATVKVICPPTVSLSANPDTIQPGISTKLTWSSTDTDSCVIEPGIGAVGPSGSIQVSPVETTRYTITATGPMGTASKSVIVAVADLVFKDVFGPKKFVKTGSGKYTETFNALAGKAKIRVYNGDASGNFQITGATILLNGTQIFGPNFDALVYKQEKDITLMTQNSLSVTLVSGAKNSYLTIEITQANPPAVTFSADPLTIYKGDSSKLSWTSTNAYICSISPSIGRVMPNGTISVSPTTNTTYSITATGGGGSATASVTVTAKDRPPTITISANPQAIPPGGSTTLTWASTNAYSCSISPSIGSIGTSGSKVIKPTKTTTYTITATGSGGSSSATVVVLVMPLPTVSLSANPESIGPEESSVLTWTSANATSCVIEPGIGPVDLSGSLTVTPTETTTYSITASNAAGAATKSATVTYDNSPIKLSIASPSHDANIECPYVLVTGNVKKYLADEVGVTVNGQIALVFDDQFAANHVPLQDGENVITAVATDSLGNTKTESVTVYANTQVKHIWIKSNSESGLLPFETELAIDASFDFKNANVYHTGGNVDYLEVRDNTFWVRLNGGGMYYFHFDAKDANLNLYSDTVAVVIPNRTAIDNLLQTRWSSLMDHLSAGDKAKALALMHSQSQQAYDQVFDQIIPKMSSISSTITGITLLDIHDNQIKYKVSTIENGIKYKYNVYFKKDNNGLWKLMSF